MILLIDAGNTRVKVAWLKPVHTRRSAPPLGLAHEELPGLAARLDFAPRRILASNVAGKGVRSALAAASRIALGPAHTLARCPRRTGSVAERLPRTGPAGRRPLGGSAGSAAPRTRRARLAGGLTLHPGQFRHRHDDRYPGLADPGRRHAPRRLHRRPDPARGGPDGPQPGPGHGRPAPGPGRTCGFPDRHRHRHPQRHRGRPGRRAAAPVAAGPPTPARACRR